MGADASSQAKKEPLDTSKLPRYTLEEVARHDKEEDLWLVIEGRVLDVTNFIQDHPGGPNILIEHAGIDSTDEFHEFGHSEAAIASLDEFVIGVLGTVDEVEAWKASQSGSGTGASGSSGDKGTGAGAGAAGGGPSGGSAGASSSGGGSKDTGSVPAKQASTASPDELPAAAVSGKRILVLYGSQKGATAEFARRTAAALKPAAEARALGVAVQSMRDFDPEDLNNEAYVVFLVSTYQGGTPPEPARFFFQWLTEAVSDFRVHSSFLEQLKFAVLGCGDSLYANNYNVAAKTLRARLGQMGAQEMCPMGASDENVSRPDHGTAETDFQAWLKTVVAVVSGNSASAPPTSASASAVDANADDEYDVVDDEEETKGTQDEPLLDMEDLGGMLSKGGAAAGGVGVASSSSSSASSASGATADKADDPWKTGPKMSRRKRRALKREARERKAQEDKESKVKQKDEDSVDVSDKPETKRQMLTDKTRKNLSKQGYKLIGSHSGVKICRWTKAMLRGRGGCYKHTFYGIKSYQCMEMTPSLACANKCVFCWRHHTNPVGKEWTWEMDEPEMILENAIANHRAMIKQMKGVPGVKPERYKEAYTIKHCALSLVGEPIMYPKINEYVNLLHGQGISTFLVTNAQFPEKIEHMQPVTQLYVSIDAATPESLKAVDRPLFPDYWQRFMDSLAAVKNKATTRTVFRLTLLKGFNMSDLADYAKLVQLGLPTFIEIKGVTYCGNNNSSHLTMKNVPFHHEVRDFCVKLCEYLGGRYEVACEHAHSCCVLISDVKMKKGGKWHTWINYPKFMELEKAFHEKGQQFTPLDYMEETPDWAVFGSPEQGFDPEEKRFYRNQRKKALEAAEAAAAASAQQATA